jgi:hypothetical protein
MEPAEIASVPDAKPVEKAKLDEAVPLAGGAGAVILALAGAGMAVRRRKRRQDEDGFEQDRKDETAIDEPEPEHLWDPPVREPAIIAAATTAPTNDLFEDFDTSKFGRHVQAAYRGPTPDNPSLSLRKRLKIAGELDRRERESGEIAQTVRPAPVVAPASRPVVANAKTPQSLIFSYSGTPTQMKWPEKQY